VNLELDNMDETLKKLIQQEIDSYMQSKQYNLSKITNHEHNGTDSNKISAINVQGFEPLPANKGGVVNPLVLGDETVIQGNSRNGYGVFNTVNKVQFPIYPIPNIMGGGSQANYTVTGAISAGATGATLGVPGATGPSGLEPYPNPTDTIPTIFSTGELADVTYTFNSSRISWPAPAIYGGTTTITQVGDSVFKGGEAVYGTMLAFSSGPDSLTPTLWVRVPVEGTEAKWFGVLLDQEAPEYYNPNNIV